MKNILFLIHITSIGIWLGCVLTEALFERALLGHGHSQELILARLHKRVDYFIEIPAFLIVFLTGVLMLNIAHGHSLLYAKIGCGLMAIIANAYCVRLVFRRAKAAEANQWEIFSRLDHLQHKIGAVVLINLLVALIIGIYLYVCA